MLFWIKGRPLQDQRASSSGTTCTSAGGDYCSHLRSGQHREWVAASWAHHFTILAISPLKCPSLNSRPNFFNPQRPAQSAYCRDSLCLLNSQTHKPDELFGTPNGNKNTSAGRDQALKAASRTISRWCGGARRVVQLRSPWGSCHAVSSEPTLASGSLGNECPLQGSLIPGPATSKRSVRSPGSCWPCPPVSSANGRTSKTPLKGSKALHMHTHEQHDPPAPLPPCQRMTPTTLLQSRTVRKAISRLLHCF